MWTFAEVLCVKLTTADTFPIITLTLNPARCGKGQDYGR